MIGLARGLAVASRTLIQRKPTQIAHIRKAQQFENPWVYRDVHVAPKRVMLTAEVMMGVFWYWVLWHVWYDFGHITGHHTYPDPSKWTDAELGIPPDDED